MPSFYSETIWTFSQAMCLALVCNKFLRNCISKIHWNSIFHCQLKTKITHHATGKNLQSLFFLTLKLSYFSKSGSSFSQSQLVAASSNCHRLWNAFVWACQSNLPMIQELGHWFCNQKPWLDFWNSLQVQLPDNWQGLDLGLKLELCHLINEL